MVIRSLSLTIIIQINAEKNNSSSIVEFAHRHHATDYYIALNDDLLNIEAILNDEDVAL